MKKILFFVILFLLPITINAAESEIVMDQDTGRILYAKNINKQDLIARTSKIMTAVIAIENGKLNNIYTVGEEINDVYGSSMYLKESEKISLKNLLYGLMLRSGNDSAVVIANNVSKNEKKFVDLMNKKAEKLNMKNTVFHNPHGLDNKNENISTAYDMALLTKYAMKNKTYRKIVKTKKRKFKTNLNNYELFNKNSLLIDYKYCTGGKTGYTEKAHKSLVTTASKDNKNLIIVSLNDPNRFANHRRLYEKYFKLYGRYKVLDKYTFSVKGKHIYKNHHLYIKDDYYMLLTKEEKEHIKLNIVLKNKKEIKNNSVVGTAQILYNDKVIGKTNIYISKRSEKLKKIKKLLHLD